MPLAPNVSSESVCTNVSSYSFDCTVYVTLSWSYLASNWKRKVETFVLIHAYSSNIVWRSVLNEIQLELVLTRSDQLTIVYLPTGVATVKLVWRLLRSQWHSRYNMTEHRLSIIMLVMLQKSKPVWSICIFPRK